jgi:hypothetical protein
VRYGGCGNVRINRLAVNFGAGLVDDHDGKSSVSQAVIASEQPGEFLAVLDRAAGGGKLDSLASLLGMPSLISK